MRLLDCLRKIQKLDRISLISKDDFSGSDFKLRGCKKILDKLSISPNEVIAIGDSPADKTMFQFAFKSIAINPKEGIEKYASFVIKNDLSNAITIIKNFL